MIKYLLLSTVIGTVGANGDCENMCSLDNHPITAYQEFVDNENQQCFIKAECLININQCDEYNYYYVGY